MERTKEAIGNKMKLATKKYTVVDLFAGVGGLSYGFTKNERFEIILANEVEKDIAKAYSLNHSTVNMLQGDIKDLSEGILRRAIGKRAVDVVVGGPPCQSYSTLGKRQMDARASLFMEYKRVLGILHPRAFLFENVKGILSMDKGTLFEHVRKEFEDIGYSLQYKILNAVDYGVPQLRERVILVGFLGENPFQYPNPTHGKGLLPHVTMHDALEDLPALSCGEESAAYAACPDNEFLSWARQGSYDTLTEHKAPNNSAHLRKIMAALKDGQDRDDLPEELRPKSGFKNTYAKLWWEKPATTITRNFACPSSSRCIHPRDSRALTIREGARLQSFPDSYQFYGSDCMKRLEIGNAVPPLLSVALAKQMLKALDREYRADTDAAESGAQNA